jgi:hypothetical protein
MPLYSAATPGRASGCPNGSSEWRLNITVTFPQIWSEI